MPSSTSLYTTSSGNANVASSNFTTLYSGSGTINPTQAYGNANVVGLLAAGSDGANTISNIIATGNVTAANFIGNVIGNITGNVVVPGSNTQVLINDNDSIGVVTGFTFDGTTLAVPGAVSATGNITGSYILGNGSQLTGLPATYGNANVATFLAAFGSNSISTTGTVTATEFYGNIIGNIIGNVVVPGSNTQVLINNNGNIGTGPGFTFNTGSNVLATPGAITAVGNVTAANFFGSGAGLSAITGANVTGTVANATAAVTAGTVTTAAQPNITSVGTLTGLTITGTTTTGNLLTGGQVSAVGNITGSYILGNGSQLTGLPATYGNANVSDYLASGTNTQNIVTLANVIGNTLLTSGSSGNIIGVNYVSANFYLGDGGLLSNVSSSYGNANVAGFMANFGSNAISTTGNVTASYFIGDGSLLTGIPGGTYGNANVANFLANFGSNILSTTGNVDSGNVNTTGLVTATGNITGANIRSPNFQAVSSAGGALKNASGTSQLQWGAGGGNNVSLDVSTNINGANAQIDISPTGNLGHVHIKPTGLGSLEIAPTTAGSINNMVIGNVTPAEVSATTVSATGNITGSYFLGNGSQLTGISSSPAGSNTQIQFNDDGAFGAATGFTFNKTSNVFTSPGNVSAVGNVNGASFNAVNYVATGNLALGGQLLGVGGAVLSYFTATNIAGGNGIVAGNAITSTNTMSAVGNITGGNIITSSLVQGASLSATGNLTESNASRLGAIVTNTFLQINTPQSTGTVNINRTNGQVQLLSPTGNVTGMQFLNFVTTATSGNQLTQVDVIVKQGATPYTVTLPTGNASIKYLSGTSNIAATANATSIINVKAANIGGAALYLVSVSGEYS